MYGRGKGERVAKRKHDRGRSVRKGAVQYLWVLGEAPCDEAAADSGIACAIPLAIDPVGVAIATAKKTEAAGLADSRRRSASGNEIHRGKQNRMLNVEHPRQPVLEGHRPFFRAAFYFRQ